MDDLAVMRETEYDDEGSSTNLDSGMTTDEVAPITKDEKLVLCSRVGVMSVLLLTALVIAGMTYRIVAENERENFEAEVRDCREDCMNCLSSAYPTLTMDHHPVRLVRGERRPDCANVQQECRKHFPQHQDSV
jgi:hypothetical protein